MVNHCFELVNNGEICSVTPGVDRPRCERRRRYTVGSNTCWLVVLTILENIRQWEGLSNYPIYTYISIYYEESKMFETTNQLGNISGLLCDWTFRYSFFLFVEFSAVFQGCKLNVKEFTGSDILERQKWASSQNRLPGRLALKNSTLHPMMLSVLP